MDVTKLFSLLVLVFFLCSMRTSSTEVSDDLNKLSGANAYFAHKLYNQLRISSQSFVVSPLGMSMALSNVYVGSCGNTLQELQSILGFSSADLSEQDVLRGYLNLVESVTQCGDGYEFDLANAQFVQDSFPIQDNFTRILADYFRADCKTVDFSDSEETLYLANGWIRNVSHGKIDSILSAVEPHTVMLLLNAIYFKGTWLTTFDEGNTHERPFFNENGVEKSTRMMLDDLNVKYSGDHAIGASVLELPYKTDTFSAVFILPTDGSSLAILEDNLTPENLLQISNEISVQRVRVVIPVMKLESQFDMVGHLGEMGIRDLFEDSACLKRISPVPLSVSQVVHKATVEISEEGCEASSSSSLHLYGRSSHHRHPSFVANRPFMFFVRHNPTNTIIFMGRVVDV